MNYSVHVNKFGDTNILNTFKVGSQFLDQYSDNSSKKNKTFSLDFFLENFHKCVNSNKIFIVIRDPYTRLLSGLQTVVDLERDLSISDDEQDVRIYNFTPLNGVRKEVRVPNDDEWLANNGYKVYLYLFNNFWFKFRNNGHLVPWLTCVEEIVDRFPQIKIVDINDLDSLLKNLGIHLTEESESFKHSNKKYYKCIEQALEHENLKPFIRAKLNNILKIESDAYSRLSPKVEKIVPNFF